MEREQAISVAGSGTADILMLFLLNMPRVACL